MEHNGGLERQEQDIWKMIAYASRYGHQPLLPLLGAITADRLLKFNDGVHFWIEAESEKGGGFPDGGG